MARKTSGQNVNWLKAVAINGQLFYGLVDVAEVRKVRHEGRAGELVLLVRPEDFSPDLLERLAEATDGREEASHARWFGT